MTKVAGIGRSQLPSPLIFDRSVKKSEALQAAVPAGADDDPIAQGDTEQGGGLCGLARRLARSLARFMDHHPLQHVDVALPRLLGEDVLSVGIAGTPTGPNARTREVDVLGVVLTIKARRQKPYNVHDRAAAIRGELFHPRVLPPL